MLSEITTAHIEDICSCPEDNRADIDPSIKPRLRALITMPMEECHAALSSIINDCAAYALASDFGMMLLITLQERIKDEDGLS